MAEIVKDIVLLPSDTQYIDTELAAEAGLDDGPVDHGRSRHNQDLRHSDVKEVHRRIGRAALDLICVLVDQPEGVVGCKFLDLFRIS